MSATTISCAFRVFRRELVHSVEVKFFVSVKCIVVKAYKWKIDIRKDSFNLSIAMA